MKKNLLLFFLLLSGVAAHAQEAKTLFVNMPDSLTPLLTAVNRADCIDFLDSKMKAQVKNKFGGTSEMTDLTPDYIRLRMSAQSEWQMKLLAISDTTKIICAVSTACAPACDSKVRFFTTSWKELPASDFLVTPSADDFFVSPTDTMQVEGYNRARSQADILLLKADLSKVDATLAFSFATMDYIGKADGDKLKPYLQSPLVYVWQKDKKQFVRK
ncbi:DUF3256 family protein [Bacteroides ihuae]|uniref:DUF3256 family protein n=1 Tax=Bacteroides ihuae TaxID=1852362 RepID=UPI0008D93C6C|nr:DUF3256 family protein [Bacteroides ihuae]